MGVGWEWSLSPLIRKLYDVAHYPAYSHSFTCASPPFLF